LKYDPRVIPKRLAQLTELAYDFYFSPAEAQYFCEVLMKLSDYPILTRKKIFNFMLRTYKALQNQLAHASYEEIARQMDRYLQLPGRAKIPAEILIPAYATACSVAECDVSHIDLCKLSSDVSETGIYLISSYNYCAYGD
jgi:hypothetical protein